MPKRWEPYHFAIPLTEGEIPMDKGGFRHVPKKNVSSSALEAVVYCRDCKHGEKANDVYLCGKSRGFGLAHEPKWFCADGEKKE